MNGMGNGIPIRPKHVLEELSLALKDHPNLIVTWIGERAMTLQVSDGTEFTLSVHFGAHFIPTTATGSGSE